MSTVVNVAGSPAAVPHALVPMRLVSWVLRGVESFSFRVRGGPLPADPDPYKGQAVTVTVNGTLRFSGYVESRHVTRVRGKGWWTVYQCLGLRHYGDFVRHADAINGGDASVYNAPKDLNPAGWVPARAGRTVGQVIADVLTMTANAQGLNAWGIGGYTGLPSAPALPAATAADLAAMTLVPPGQMTVGGEKLLSAVESFLSTWCPWYCMRVRPDGVIRFLDLRSFPPVTLTLNSDPVGLSPASSDSSGCASRVLLTGQSLAEACLFSTLNGGLDETPFAWGPYTVAQAKANWTPANWTNPLVLSGQPGEVSGTCTCPSTTTVTVTSSDASVNFPANYFDQTSTGHLGSLFLSWSAGTDLTTYAQRLIVSNTAMAAGGPATLTVDRALPHLNFDKFTVTSQAHGPNAVWTVYRMNPAAYRARVAPQTSWPYSYRTNGNSGVSTTTVAMGTVVYGSAAPYQSVTLPVTVDPVTGYVHFPQPAYMMAGNRVPYEVRAMVPCYVGVNQVASPQDVGGVPRYTGRLYTSEGVSRTLPVYVPGWRDPANATAMQAYADALLDSVKDPVEECDLVYHGLLESVLEAGVSVTVAGNGYPTPWQAGSLPVVECALEWGTDGDARSVWTTSARLSNRKDHYSAEAFLRPDRTGVTFDWAAAFGPSDWAAAAATMPNPGAGLGSVNVGDLPGPAGLMPNPAGLVDLSSGADFGPGPLGMTGGPLGPANAGFEAAEASARDALAGQARAAFGGDQGDGGRG